MGPDTTIAALSRRLPANRYRTVLADRRIDPPAGRAVPRLAAFGFGTGAVSASLAILWLITISITAQDADDPAALLIVGTILAVCAGVVGGAVGCALACVGGAGLFLAGRLKLGRIVFPALAGLTQSAVMWWYAVDLFASAQPRTISTIAGSAVIAVVISSRSTAHLLVRLSLFTPHDAAAPRQPPAAPNNRRRRRPRSSTTTS